VARAELGLRVQQLPLHPIIRIPHLVEVHTAAVGEPAKTWPTHHWRGSTGRSRSPPSSRRRRARTRHRHVWCTAHSVSPAGCSVPPWRRRSARASRRGGDALRPATARSHTPASPAARRCRQLALSYRQRPLPELLSCLTCAPSADRSKVACTVVAPRLAQTITHLPSTVRCAKRMRSVSTVIWRWGGARQRLASAPRSRGQRQHRGPHRPAHRLVDEVHDDRAPRSGQYVWQRCSAGVASRTASS